MEWSGQERRKFRRAMFPCKIVISSPARLLTSHTENISAGGIKVLLEEKLNPFTTVGLEIFVEKGKPVKCKGKVVWVNEKVNPVARQAVLYATGIKFDEMSQVDRDYLGKLVDAITPEDEDENDVSLE